MAFRVLNGIMAALFAFGAAVQYNDPDPGRWIAIYLAACIVCILAAARVSARVVAPLGFGAGTVALTWSLGLSTAVRDSNVYRHMFDSWEMKSAPIEEAREATGLVIIAVWMAVLVAHRWVGTRQRQA